ncbi:MAG: phosphate acyltransferase PlsX [Anaerolineae bacterium]
MVRIAIDAMGGDYAPEEVIKGAVEAAREYEGLELILVGREETVRPLLDAEGLPLPIKAASQVIAMEEQPAQAVRAKKDSSIVVATEMVRDGQADAVVTMGHSGAGMVAALLILGRIEGIQRPAAGVHYFNLQSQTFMLDLGLSVDCKAEHLLQFALMGSIYAQKVLGIERPAVALLSNGAEDNKGNQVGREAFLLLKESGLNFIGNVEGLDIPRGRANVIVCDGFAGNVVLKLTEGLSEALFDMMEEEMRTALPGEVFQSHFLPALARLRKKMDYAEIGGAPVLGVNGISIIGHGRSKAKAVKSAIYQAKLAVERNLVEAIRMEIERRDREGR